MQTIIAVLFFIVGFLVALELLVHMIYHCKTGKAGLYDPPFEYLKDIWRNFRGNINRNRKHQCRQSKTY